jgi:hypothetical protein
LKNAGRNFIIHLDNKKNIKIGPKIKKNLGIGPETRSPD